MRVLQIASFSLALCGVFVGVSCRTQPQITPRVISNTKPAASADPSRIKRDIGLLTSKEFEGRGPGSNGLGLAAQLIAAELRLANLVPAGNDDYWSDFEVPALELQPGVTGEVRGSVVLKNIASIVSYGGVRAADVEGELVYDDFAEDPPRPLQQQIALLPEWRDGRFDLQDLKARIQRAASAGALAVLTIPDELYPPPLDPPSLGELPVPVARIHPKLAARWLREHPANNAFGPLSVWVSLHFIGRQLIPAHNMVGAIPGAKDERKAIVVSAHYDHIGMGRPNWDGELDTIHPGADDNASGTAALLEVARILSAMPSCQRPLFFVGFSYEEEGLLGSEALIAKTSNIELAINLDMVGRKNGLPIEIDGRPSRPMKEALNEVMQDGWFYGPLATPSEGPQSDHTTFLLRQIPAITLTTGLHEDHHQPTDTPDKIDYKGIAEIVDDTVSIIRELNCK